MDRVVDEQHTRKAKRQILREATVEKLWKAYSVPLFHGIQPHKEQYTETKRCFFASFYEMTSIYEAIYRELDEVEAEEKMNELKLEAEPYAMEVRDKALGVAH